MGRVYAGDVCRYALLMCSYVGLPALSCPLFLSTEHIPVMAFTHQDILTVNFMPIMCAQIRMEEGTPIVVPSCGVFGKRAEPAFKANTQATSNGASRVRMF